MNPKISLIISTYGRLEEVEELLNSLSLQELDSSYFEVLIIDQNDKIILEEIVKKYESLLVLRHIKVNFKGLAKAKNCGLNLVRGEIVSFPDDDCTYYPDTLTKVLDFFSTGKSNVVYGRLYDRNRNKNIMRKWPKEEILVNYYNYHYSYSAVTIFTRNKKRTFNENFGVGTKYGVGEELDYLFRSLKEGEAGIYTPSIEIWHPELNPNLMSDEKAFSYAYGYGAVVRKHITFKVFIHFLASCTYQIVGVIKGCISFNTNQIKKRWFAFKGRLLGFIKFKENI